MLLFIWPVCLFASASTYVPTERQVLLWSAQAFPLAGRYVLSDPSSNGKPLAWPNTGRAVLAFG